MIKTKVTCDLSGLDKLKSDIKKAASKKGEVGFYDDQHHRKGNKITPMSLIAYVNNFGTDKVPIPSRPFFDDAVDDSKMEVKSILSREWAKILAGKSPNKALEKSADVISKYITDNIRNNTYTPNEESTLKRKEGDQPLVDTGQLMDAARVKVKEIKNGKS